MKPKSISALIYKVSDLEKTISFYEGLGFKVSKKEDKVAVVYVNWFSVEFHEDSSIKDKTKDGPLVLVSVDLKDFYESASNAGYKIETEPTKTINGRTEFSLRDPDGYLMIFFEKK